MTDPYLWLEDVTGDDALDWVRTHSDATVSDLASGSTFTDLENRIRSILDTDARIPYVRARGRHLYNFWKDADHPRGVWRRTSMAQYRSDSPEWETLVDLDALAESEGENWVWKGAAILRPAQEFALVTLSRGGADASVVREFSLTTRTFRDAGDGGFVVPEAKTDIGWIDENTVFLGTDLGEGTLTDSGYPRLAVRWRRGTPIDSADVVFEGETSDVAVSAWYDNTVGYERSFAQRATDFFNSELYLLRDDGTRVLVDVPTDASASVHRDWLLIRTMTPWSVDGTEHAAGTLLAAKFDEYLAGSRELRVLFAPDEHTSLHQYAWTENHLLMVVLRDVKSTVLVGTLTDDGFSALPMTGLPELTDIEIIGTDSDEGGDEYFLNSSGYLTPATLLFGSVGPLGTEPESLKQAPSFFDATGLHVEQFFTTSDDGTSIPYFVVRQREGGPGPTLMYGYGGFEISMTPAYSGAMGSAWLERGGTYVVANIRGGGEYGPSWHTQVLRAGRHKVGEDFASVARDLVERGITTPSQLGAQGGSNGGLLMGIMLTSYPELFGALVCQVPLLDMKRYHLLLAGASWVAEYGDPDDPDEWAFISEYSPYQRVDADAAYPPILIMTSTRDDRVHPGHARKMAAVLEEQGHSVRYYENIEGGHGGAADNKQLAFKTALAYDWLWNTLTA
ncbi:prolyl oligopeptidase family serine peptidase [Rhodococcoides trifolii]|uniref:prolyl oligopeptidase family serine peptidase n=1 Tax=Rhodococcoides trifolii TaxID=908250 RepID=UPI0035300202